ncbi:MAG: EFR1 family ferrodoxin [Kiritimatiellales bacterium]|jgi:Pyruvate/2-oxoacid:ferredoxin oxidoreductase delta subunit
MKTIIYWFSGTGNSLAAAKALAKSCGDAELIPMAKALRNPPPAAERIGLVFPVYSFGPPALVARFVEKLNASPDSYIFSVITYAGNQGGTLAILRRLLQKRGLDLAAGWGVKMPENYPPLGGAPAPEKQQAVNVEADEQIGKIAEELQQSPHGRYESSTMFWRILSRVAYPLFKKNVPRADRFFRADEKCNGCCICAQVCPVNDVVMLDGRPTWLGHCEQCFACFHWCPQKAVQYGRSAKQHRYHHPAVKLSDFL